MLLIFILYSYLHFRIKLGLKQAILAILASLQLSTVSNWLPLTNRMCEQQVGGASLLKANR